MVSGVILCHVNTANQSQFIISKQTKTPETIRFSGVLVFCILLRFDLYDIIISLIEKENLYET